MADDFYEPNASNIVGVGQAAQMGGANANAVTTGMDLGQQLQQQITRTQGMKDQLAKQMSDNHDAMVNHVGQAMYNLADADDDEKKGPVWKMNRDETIKKAQQLGVNMDPDVFNAFITDPTHSGKLTAALGQMFTDPTASPHDTAEALRTLHDNFGSMDEAVKAPTELTDAFAKTRAASLRATNTFQTRADKIRDQVKGINGKWDQTEQFTDNALNILNKPGLAQTGQGQTMLQEAYTRAGSGSAIRSFTLQLGQENRPLADKMMGALQKIQTGSKLQPEELAAMKEGLQIYSKNANGYRDNEVSTYYNSAKGISQQATANGYQIPSNTMIPDDQWSRLADQEDKRNNPAPVKPQAKKSVKSSSVIPNYQIGKNSAGDGLIKGFIGNGMSLSDINQRLIKFNRSQLTQDDYNNLKGSH
jgi:hypothetical protein